MDVNDELALDDVEHLLRRTLQVKATAVAAAPRPLNVLTGSRRRRPDRPFGWAAVAACVIALAGAAGLAVRVVSDGAAPASPATTPTAPPTTVVPATTVAGPDPDGPHTAYATIAVSGGLTDGLTENLTLAGDDIDTSFGGSAADGRPHVNTHNRRVDGVLYVYFPQSDGSYAWTYDPDDVTTLSAHPSGHTPFELYDQVAEPATFQMVEETDVDGVPVRHIRATTPDAVDFELLPLAGHSGDVTGLELWVTADNVVLRMDVTLDGDPPTSIAIEFEDVGSPEIDLAAPEGATELDGVG